MSAGILVIHLVAEKDQCEANNESADLVIGAAVLIMQGEKTKNAIVAEAARILRPGGRYAIHELGLVPEELSDEVKTENRQGLARAIKVNARPLTLSEWTSVLESNGLKVIKVETAPMALLQPRRILSDEGIVGALRFAKNLLSNSVAPTRAADAPHFPYPQRASQRCSDCGDKVITASLR